MISLWYKHVETRNLKRFLGGILDYTGIHHFVEASVIGFLDTFRTFADRHITNDMIVGCV